MTDTPTGPSEPDPDRIADEVLNLAKQADSERVARAILDVIRDLLSIAYDAGCREDVGEANGIVLQALLDRSKLDINERAMSPARWWNYLAYGLCGAYKSVMTGSPDPMTPLQGIATVGEISPDGELRIVENLDESSGSDLPGRGRTAGFRLLMTYLNGDMETWNALWSALEPQDTEDGRYVFAVLAVLLQVAEIVLDEAEMQGTLPAAAVETRRRRSGHVDPALAYDQHHQHDHGAEVVITGLSEVEPDPRDLSPDDRHLMGDGRGLYLVAVYEHQRMPRPAVVAATTQVLQAIASESGTPTCGVFHDLDVSLDQLPHSGRDAAAANLAAAERTLGHTCYLIRVWTHIAGCCPQQAPPAPEAP